VCGDAQWRLRRGRLTRERRGSCDGGGADAGCGEPGAAPGNPLRPAPSAVEEPSPELLLRLNAAVRARGAGYAAKEVVVIVPEGRGALAPAARPLLGELARRFIPNSVLLVATEADVSGELGQRIAWLRERRLLRGRATAYVCERGVCQLPTTEPRVLAAQLAETRPYP